MEQIIEQFLSLSNFQQAWYKVAEKQGCAGVDGETIEDFSRQQETNLPELRDAVANSTYQPQPCKQILIPKKKGDWRELRVPTVRDRIVQQALLNIFYSITETKFSPASFAYRPNKSYLDAVKKVAAWRDLGYEWVLDGDIVEFFDSIDHQRLLREVRKYLDNPGILCLIKAWISVGTLTNSRLILPEKGIPQGAVISPLLANIYLDQFDWLIAESADLKLVRYADDFVILSQSQERIIQVREEVAKILQAMNLELHQEKTRITNFESGFRFLGHGFLQKAIFPDDPPQELDTSAGNLRDKKKFFSKFPHKQKRNQKKKRSNRHPWRTRFQHH